MLSREQEMKKTRRQKYCATAEGNIKVVKNYPFEILHEIGVFYDDVFQHYKEPFYIIWSMLTHIMKYTLYLGH